MILIKRATDLMVLLSKKRNAGETIGFVPTMGALHDGHISLINEAKKTTNCVICSIFVNPTQFNDPQDFEKYPHTIEDDIYKLESSTCDILFLPTVSEMYPKGFLEKGHYDLGYIETILEGKFRPGHFQGVCQIVDKLLQIVHPNYLFLGQKDYQQCMVIKQLITLTKNNATVVICPTLRQTDGLAMSSRNMRLSIEERMHATEIYKTLINIDKKIKSTNISELKNEATDYLTNKGFTVEYVEIADAANLTPIEVWQSQQPTVVLIAAFYNNIRLIDNWLITN